MVVEKSCACVSVIIPILTLNQLVYEVFSKSRDEFDSTQSERFDHKVKISRLLFVHVILEESI